MEFIFSVLVFILDDFKPASVDTTKEALVEIGQGHHVTLTVPHVEVSDPKSSFDTFDCNHPPIASIFTGSYFILKFSV